MAGDQSVQDRPGPVELGDRRVIAGERHVDPAGAEVAADPAGERAVIVGLVGRLLDQAAVRRDGRSRSSSRSLSGSGLFRNMRTW